jgi:predicted AlkP superfamily phosphohydrolase/phosphomutase
MRSTVPPITVPAWASMVSGRDPGELGLYGFRNRRRGSYALDVATSHDVRVKRAWDLLGEAGKRVAALFVPLTSPPTPVRGVMASCFMTEAGAPWTFPATLGAELEARFGPYLADVHDYRTDEPSALLESLHASARQHFAIARHVWRVERPDFLMMVEMGPDRLHHALYHHMDETHPRHAPGSRWTDEARAYYTALDALVGELVDDAGDDTTVLVVSDHGARPMLGGVAVNELLRREGWLALHEEPAAPRALEPDMVDWSRTRAWGEGGYYARIFLNVEGREPEGIVAPRRFEAERDALEALLASLTGPDGNPLETRIVKPERAFRETRGTPPDLMAFFGDLAYRSIGSVGHRDIFTETNDTGPDACNHDWDGIFVMSGGRAPAHGRVDGLSIYDVTRTVLGLMDVAAPHDLLGSDRSRA